MVCMFSKVYIVQFNKQISCYFKNSMLHNNKSTKFILQFMSKPKNLFDNLQNTKLIQKKQTDTNFNNQMSKAGIISQQLHQRALYTNLDCINPNCLSKFYEDQQQIIYFYIGMLHPSKDNNRKNNSSTGQKKIIQKLSMFLLKKLLVNDKKVYTIVFFNQNSDSNAYNELKSILMCFPFEYFSQLNQFILVQPSFFHKASNSMFSFNVLNKFMKNKSTNIQNIKQLSEKIHFPVQNIIASLPQQVVLQQFLQLHPKVQEKSKNLGQQKKPIQAKLFKNILVPSSSTSNIQKLQLSQYCLNEIGIPVILESLILYLQASQNGLNQQGIFRKSVSIDEQNQTMAQMRNNNFDYLMNITNPHIVANIIKRFLANLKTPIIPQESYKTMMHDEGIADKVRFYKQIIQDIPNVNYQTLAYLCRFLKQDVISRQKLNKMPIKNIAICFTPCIMRFQVPSIADMFYATKAASSMELILDRYDQIFDQQKQEEIAHKSFIQNKKSFVRQSLNLNLNSGFFRDSVEFNIGQCMFKEPYINQKIQSAQNVPNMTKSKQKSVIHKNKVQEDYEINHQDSSGYYSTNVNQTLLKKDSYKNYSQFNQIPIKKQSSNNQKNLIQANQTKLKQKQSNYDEQIFKSKINFDLKEQNCEIDRPHKSMTRSRLACRVNTINAEVLQHNSFRFQGCLEEQIKNIQYLDNKKFQEFKKQKKQIEVYQFQDQASQKDAEWLKQLQQGKQVTQSFIRVSYLDQDLSDQFQVLNMDDIDEENLKYNQNLNNFHKKQ